MNLLEQIANYIIEETKGYNSYVATSYSSSKHDITIRILTPNVFITVSPIGVRVKYWREGGGSTPYIMDFDFGDPTMIDTIVDKLKEWVGMKPLAEY